MWHGTVMGARQRSRRSCCNFDPKLHIVCKYGRVMAWWHPSERAAPQTRSSLSLLHRGSRPHTQEWLRVPVASQVWEGDGVVASFRKLVGATDPLKAEPGTVRGDFGRVTGRNIVHASDSPDNGEREASECFPVAQMNATLNKELRKFSMFESI